MNEKIQGLAIVPTPIGNLGDITVRAKHYLETADFILAEDTRTSSVLLQHLGIKKPVKSYHLFNEKSALEGILQSLRDGQSIAWISDAGTPSISDPGSLLIQAVIQEQLPLTCLPGPTALIPALILSGYPSQPFTFFGFLPHKKGRQTAWKKLAALHHTLVLYESPHRIVKLAEELPKYFPGSTPIAVVREISKKFEEVIRTTAEQASSKLQTSTLKGEMVVVIDHHEKSS